MFNARLVISILSMILARGIAHAQELDLSRSSLQDIAARPYHAEQLTAQRTSRSDPLLNGALIGAGVGVGIGMIAAPLYYCGTTDSECSTIVRIVIGLPSIAAGAGFGALIDAAVRRDSRHGPGADRSVAVAPILGRRDKGVHVAVRF